MEEVVESRKLKYKALKNRVCAERKKSKKMPTIAITDLEPSEIPHHFNLTYRLPTKLEFSPRKTEKISLPPHLNCGIATSGSPINETLIRSRINVIILTTLAKMKREFPGKPCTGVASPASLKSIHLQFDREIDFIWKSDDRRVRLSGIVDYSLWYGMADDYSTNMVMVEARQPDLIKRGVLQCLAYMAMIHETRKRAKIIDTSVYGIATDSFQWVFIRIRPNGEWTEKAYHWVHNAQEIVSMLANIFAHTATSHKWWNLGIETEVSASLEQPKLKPKSKRDMRHSI
ncbi:uncharacterized protein N7487_004839 [Penicillium crustosum]|uniref:uncharacterized protein n=1 Tax=Penicillium crustosum TaxID=36656 RepID=UPI00239F16F9|nr:uncharacterized protein N7487_004839 [Penicillium crustosum]KAJ5410480.1 hypothetical protein N7487_004839 [Penicillium crustosum]